MTARPPIPRVLQRAAGLLLTLISFQVPAGEIPLGYRRIAAEHGIPARLFYAIALVESRGASRLPWPWSLNVAGESLRFPTRKSAWLALQGFLNRGIRRIDIGLMQVNWRYHADRLGDPWQALDPYHNLRVGAEILREEYRRCGDWLEAAGRYHNPGTTPKQRGLAAAYRERVTALMRSEAGS